MPQAGPSASSAPQPGGTFAGPPLAFPLVTENAFRTLGVSAGAARAELQTALASFRRALKLEVPKTTDWDVAWLRPVERTEGALQSAAARTGDVERRLIDRLFWFGADAKDVLRQPLGPSVPIIRSADGPERRHDAALLALVHATVADPSFQRESVWSAAIEGWRRAVGEDAYWMHILTLEADGGFEPAANGEDVRAVRARALNLALSPVLAAAKAAASHGDDAPLGRIVRMLRACGLPDDIRFGWENEILGPMEEEVAKICVSIRSDRTDKIVHENDAAATNKPICAAIAKRLDAELMPRLQALESVVGRDEPFAQRSRGEVAQCFADVASGWTWADDFMSSEALLKRATALAVGTPAEGRIQESAKRIANPAQRQRDRFTPVKTAPVLFTLNGFGLKLYSLGTAYPPAPQWVYATYYITALYFPIIPLRRYIVTQRGNGWLFHGSVRFGLVQWLHLIIGLCLVAAFPLFPALYDSSFR